MVRGVVVAFSLVEKKILLFAFRFDHDRNKEKKN